MPEYPALLFVCGFHLHNQTPCALLPAACSSWHGYHFRWLEAQFPSVSLRSYADGVTSSLWNGPMFMQLLLTLADRCNPPFSLTFSRKAHDTLRAPIDLQAEIYRIYYLHSKNGCNYRFVKPKLKLHYIFWQSIRWPRGPRMFH